MPDMSKTASLAQCAALGKEVRKLLDDAGDSWFVSDAMIQPYLQPCANAVVQADEGTAPAALQEELLKLLTESGYGWLISNDKLQPYLQPMVNAVMGAQEYERPPQPQPPESETT